MDTDKKERIERNKKKYLWLHRMHVSIFLLVLFRVALKLLDYHELNILFIPTVIIFLIYSSTKDASFLFEKIFYFITGIFGGLSVSSLEVGLDFTIEKMLWLGYFTWCLWFFLLLSSIFIFYRVFEMKFEEI